MGRFLDVIIMIIYSLTNVEVRLAGVCDGCVAKQRIEDLQKKMVIFIISSLFFFVN